MINEIVFTDSFKEFVKKKVDMVVDKGDIEYVVLYNNWLVDDGFISYVREILQIPITYGNNIVKEFRLNNGTPYLMNKAILSHNDIRKEFDRESFVYAILFVKDIVFDIMRKECIYEYERGLMSCRLYPLKVKVKGARMKQLKEFVERELLKEHNNSIVGMHNKIYGWDSKSCELIHFNCKESIEVVCNENDIDWFRYLYMLFQFKRHSKYHYFKYNAETNKFKFFYLEDVIENVSIPMIVKAIIDNSKGFDYSHRYYLNKYMNERGFK